MTNKNLHELTDIQLAIMNEVWRRGSATVTDVHEAINHATGHAKKTIGTLMARLEKQRFLTHRTEGREFVYEAAVSKDEVGTAKVRNVLERLFGGSFPALVSHALESNEVAPRDVEKVRELIAEWEKKSKKERKR
jgi:BlaI family transcriptional regulator, penicillinase repressor